VGTLASPAVSRIRSHRWEGRLRRPRLFTRNKPLFPHSTAVTQNIEPCEKPHASRLPPVARASVARVAQSFSTPLYTITIKTSATSATSDTNTTRLAANYCNNCNIWNKLLSTSSHIDLDCYVGKRRTGYGPGLPPPWLRMVQCPICKDYMVFVLSEGGTQKCTNEAPMASCLSCYYS
jgi:hypothetical protein